MRIQWFALLALLSADAMFRTAAVPQRVLRGIDEVPVSIDLFVRRIGASDTIAVKQIVNVRYEHPTRGKWSTGLPQGLTLCSGVTDGEGNRAEVSRVHEALVRCDGWGSFEMRGSLFAAVDSANWAADESFISFILTPDTFGVVKYGHVRFDCVVDGVHYRRQGVWWTPLDPGEAVIEPSTRPRVGEAPTVHVERAVRPMSSTDSSSVEIPVLVAVSRAGRVKDAQPYGLLRGVSEASKQAAVAAAWKWRFAPAMSKGQPISMIYVIKVPVSPAAVDQSEH